MNGTRRYTDPRALSARSLGADRTLNRPTLSWSGRGAGRIRLGSAGCCIGRSFLRRRNQTLADSRNVRQCKALARQRLVCGGHFSGFVAPGPRMRPRVLRAAKIRFPNDCGAGEVTAPDKGDLHGKAELRIQIAELKVRPDGRTPV